MTQILANVGFAWLMVNLAILVMLDRAQVQQIGRTVGRFLRAIGAR